jgi:hypothetical protein
MSEAPSLKKQLQDILEHRIRNAVASNQDAQDSGRDPEDAMQQEIDGGNLQIHNLLAQTSVPSIKKYRDQIVDVLYKRDPVIALVLAAVMRITHPTERDQAYAADNEDFGTDTRPTTGPWDKIQNLTREWKQALISDEEYRDAVLPVLSLIFGERIEDMAPGTTFTALSKEALGRCLWVYDGDGMISQVVVLGISSFVGRSRPWRDVIVHTTIRDVHPPKETS